MYFILRFRLLGHQNYQLLHLATSLVFHSPYLAELRFRRLQVLVFLKQNLCGTLKINVNFFYISDKLQPKSRVDNLCYLLARNAFG